MGVTKLEGYGYVLDCVIKQGMLARGDTIRIQTSQGFIQTKIKSILTNPSNKDSKHSTQFVQQSSVKGANGIKIYADLIERASVGTSI